MILYPFHFQQSRSVRRTRRLIDNPDDIVQPLQQLPDVENNSDVTMTSASARASRAAVRKTRQKK